MGYPCFVENDGTIGVAPKTGVRWPQIDGLRAFAATLVFLMHAWVILGVNVAFAFVYKPSLSFTLYAGEETARTISPFFRQAGGLGVAVFFAISGFLLYQPFVRARDEGSKLALKPYFLRRAARIIPAYWAALIVIGLITGNDHVFTWSGFVNYFMFGEIWTTLDVSRLIDPKPYDPLKVSLTSSFSIINNNPVPVAWTLCVEVFFYLMLPAWAWLLAKLTSARRRPIRTELIVIAVVMVLSLAYKAWVISTVSEWEYESWLMIPPATIDTFMVGMALACLSVRASRHGWPKLFAAVGRRAGVCWLLALAAYAALCLIEAQWQWRADRIESVAGLEARDFFATLTFAWSEARILIVALLLAPAVVGAVKVKGIARVLTSKAVVWIGLVSYGLYLWHMFVLHQVVDQFGWSPVQVVAVPFVAAGCYEMTLAIAALSWYGIERRVLARVHSIPLARTLSGTANKEAVK